MSKEVPLQVNMFTGDLVDTRTRKQKKTAAEQAKPKQAEMFSQREMAQFGVNPRPLLCGIFLLLYINIPPTSFHFLLRGTKIILLLRKGPIPDFSAEHYAVTGYLKVATALSQKMAKIAVAHC